MATARQWLAGRAANLLIIVLLATSLTMTAVNQVQIRRQSDCLARWADAYTARVQQLTSASNARQQALDDFLRSLNTRNVSTETAKYKAYLHASDMYEQQQKANPVPDSPRLHC